MVLKRLAEVVLFGVCALFISGCERIPEWERKTTLSKDFDQARRLTEFKKWLWTCRGIIPNFALEKGHAALGAEIDKFLDHFRRKGISGIDTTGLKTLLGTAALWNENGYLVIPLSWVENVQEIECSYGNDAWLPAKLVGVDHALDTAVLKAEIPAAWNFRKGTRWIQREDALGLNERLILLSSAYPGQLDVLQLSYQPLRGDLFTGMDEQLILFLPPPPAISTGGLVVDEKLRVVGYALTFGEKVWGAAIKISKLDENISAILKWGKVLRPYVGMKLKLMPDQTFSVQQIDIGGPAHLAGLRSEDVILEWNRVKLKGLSDWLEIRTSEIGRAVPVVYKRGDKITETQVKIASE